MAKYVLRKPVEVFKVVEVEPCDCPLEEFGSNYCILENGNRVKESGVIVGDYFVREYDREICPAGFLSQEVLNQTYRAAPIDDPLEVLRDLMKALDDPKLGNFRDVDTAVARARNLLENEDGLK